MRCRSGPTLKMSHVAPSRPMKRIFVPLRVVAPRGRHVVRAAPAHALPVDVDLRVAARVRHVGELPPGTERGVRVEAAARHLLEARAVGRPTKMSLCPFCETTSAIFEPAERDAEDEPRRREHRRGSRRPGRARSCRPATRRVVDAAARADGGSERHVRRRRQAARGPGRRCRSRRSPSARAPSSR